MPRAKRKAKARRGYTQQERNQLLSGVSMTTRFGVTHKSTCDWDGLRTAWNDLREELLPAWIAAHPFSRPLGWLMFDATEPREVVIGEAAIEAVEHYRSDPHDYRLMRGFDSLNHRLGVPERSDASAILETERQYLSRIGALTPAELALL